MLPFTETGLMQRPAVAALRVAQGWDKRAESTPAVEQEATLWKTAVGQSSETTALHCASAY